MGSRRLLPGALTARYLLLSGMLAAGVALVAYAAMAKLGTAGILAPLAIALAVMLLLRPVAAVSLVVALAILCEGPKFGIFTFTDHIYTQLYRDISLLDAFVALAVASVGIDLLRTRRSLRFPRPLVLPILTLVLAMLAGVITGHASGASLKFAIFSEHVLAYLVLLPVAVANLDLDAGEVTRMLGWLMGIAIFKAVLGLIEVAGHLGAQIEGTSTLTYYEPTANWVIMTALLVIGAALLARQRLPRWVLLGSPLLLACLVLSYRRSFWIGAVLGVLFLLVLGTSPVSRRMLIPAALAIVAAVLLLGSVHFQSQLPLAKRLTSLSPTSIQANRQDRYRLDERANVLAAIKENPITGLGVTIPWRATARPLPLEGEGEPRQYVHFAALWYWMKLGILGLLAYLGLILASMILAWQTWRRRPEPLLSAFGLGSLCAVIGLVVIDTTASFTGVDPRFTIVFAAQVGLLGLLAGTSRSAAQDR